MLDIHSHFMPHDLPDLGASTGDPRWPRLVVDADAEMGRIFRGDQLFRVVSPACWDPARRAHELAHAGIASELISPIPVSITYWAEPHLATEFARAINNWAAELVEESGGHVKALGTVPLQDPSAAIQEMTRSLGLGLSGIEIGTSVAGHELGDPRLRPFFRAAADLGVPLFVHPTDGDLATRATSQVDRFALGMHADTALAASSLLFSGTMSDVLDLRICLAHGGGALPWALPRLIHKAVNDGLGTASCFHDLASRFWVDSLVFDARHLALLMAHFGVEHIMYGSDYPFIAREDPPGAIFEQAATLGVLTPVDTSLIAEGNARDFFRIDGAALSH